MYHVLSTLAYIFISPENWLLALLIGFFLVKSTLKKKVFSILILIVVLFFGNHFIYTKLVTGWQTKPVFLSASVQYEAGIVLGGAASFDKFGNGYFNSSADRFIETCILYKTGKIKKIIITGGSNETGQPKDADFQYKKMVELGISANDIIVENASRTTFENAVFSKMKIDSLHLKPSFVLVTSAMHMPRAVRVFSKAGIPVVPFPCNYSVMDTKLTFSDYIVPDFGTFFSWGSFLKEVFGVVGYKLFNKA